MNAREKNVIIAISQAELNFHTYRRHDIIYQLRLNNSQKHVYYRNSSLQPFSRTHYTNS